MEMKGPRKNKNKNRTRNTFLATDEACVAIYSNLRKALRGGHLSALGSQQRRLTFLRPQYPNGSQV